MSLARLWVVRLSFITLAISLISFATIGGCPQPQQPDTLQPGGGDDTITPTDNTPVDSGRPIPGVPIDTGGGDGNPDDTPGTGTSGGTQPIIVVITAPQDTDLNLAPGAQARVAYEVYGGNPASGAISVTLFYDKDGLDGTGDERVLLTGLPPQASEQLSTAGIASDSYYIGLRAANTTQTATAYAAGRLIIVAPPTVALIQPSANQVVRPGAAVPVQFSISSLASSVSYNVFVDRDTALNSNEVTAFSGGGLSGTGIIFTDGYAAGTYYLGVTVSDSTDQEGTFYLSGASGLRTVTVDIAPKISIAMPNPPVGGVVQAGDKVDLAIHAEDAEGAATVKVYRDADAILNGNEQVFAEFALTTPTADFLTQFDTAGLAAGTYRLGASIADGVGNPIAAYATGTVRINAIPEVIIEAPTTNVTVQAGTAVNIKWKASDLENKLRFVRVLLAPDQDGDSVPDSAWQTLTTFSDQQVSTKTYNIATGALNGRYLIAVEAEDDIPAIGRTVASGALIVSNDSPVITLTSPNAQVARRPGGTVAMTFSVTDRENALKPQPNGIRVIVARDDNNDGLPDGAPVYSVASAFFAAGANSYTFDTLPIQTQGLLDVGGNGRFLIGVRVEDTAGNVTIVYAVGGLLIDAVIPTIELLEPTDHAVRIKPGNVHIKLRTYDTSSATFSVRLDTNATPNQGGANEPQLIAPTAAPAGENIFEYDIDTTGLPEGLFAYRLYIADAVTPTEETYAPETADQNDFSELRKLCVTDGSFVTITQPALAPVGARPGMFMATQFAVNVCGPALKAQPDGIKVILAYDNDGDGLPDGDPVYTTDADQSLDFVAGNNTYDLDASDIEAKGLLDVGGNARFVFGVQTEDMTGAILRRYGGHVLIDSVEPVVVLTAPVYDDLPIVIDRTITTLEIRVQITDTSTDKLTIVLDRDNNPATTSPDDILVADAVEVLPGTPQELVFTVDFNDPPEAPKALGLYYIHVAVSDAIDPAVEWYGPDALADQLNQGKLTRVNVRDRLVGDFYLETLETPPEVDQPLGGILQGYQFNDLSGSAMTRVPDLDGDGIDELLLAARYGKPYMIEHDGVGFGEAYLMYGGTRLSGSQSVNSIGRGWIDGLLFPGIRIPLNTTWTKGLSDLTFVPDMDGDNKPELVFSFPRVESLSIQVADQLYQHPELFPDVAGMGLYEYNAINPMLGFVPNEAQFTRGGIVIVSSQNTLLTNRGTWNRKGDRILDLAEVGQLFGNMQPPQLVPYVKAVLHGDLTVNPPLPFVGTINCAAPGDPPDMKEFNRWTRFWDVVLDTQGPGGFNQPWTAVTADPPLTNPGNVPFPSMMPPWVTIAGQNDHPATCDELCHWANTWYIWPPCTMAPMPCMSACFYSWDAGMVSAWTGFYGPFTGITVNTVGARIMGQDGLLRDPHSGAASSYGDEFGTAVTTDGNYLYISAPQHTALRDDVPQMSESSRSKSGVVYQMRVNTRASASDPNKAQLWIEPGMAYPTPDAQLQGRLDWTMPVPHQYIIETVGSFRGDWTTQIMDLAYDGGGCPASFDPGLDQAQADACYAYTPYDINTAGDIVDRVNQIVGPHANAQISYVKSVGDINDDGNPDFAVGADTIRSDFSNPASPVVGAVFIVFGRATGAQGDYLLEKIALAPTDGGRLRGVLLKGQTGEKLARVFDGAGDVNGDGIADVIVGNEAGNGGTGEAIIILGSRTLTSPAGGYTVDTIVADHRAIWLKGAAAGDLAGANVAGAGDIDGDGYADTLITAPKAVDPNNPAAHPGVAYLLYGSPQLPGVINLGDIGTSAAPGVVFVGRMDGDNLGGGTVTVPNTDANGGSTTAYSVGVAKLGDLDGDGLGDFGISAILASPFFQYHAGETYIIYGKGD